MRSCQAQAFAVVNRQLPERAAEIGPEEKEPIIFYLSLLCNSLMLFCWLRVYYTYMYPRPGTLPMSARRGEGAKAISK
uniref:Uncharacterized protein n=1 Tax=Oryza glumipatula TaxID=40148 RepID=A0A0D9ZR12_9ORYZ